MNQIQIFFTVVISIMMPLSILIGLYLKSKGITKRDFNRHGFYW